MNAPITLSQDPAASRTCVLLEIGGAYYGCRSAAQAAQIADLLSDAPRLDFQFDPAAAEVYYTPAASARDGAPGKVRIEYGAKIRDTPTSPAPPAPAGAEILSQGAAMSAALVMAGG